MYPSYNELDSQAVTCNGFTLRIACSLGQISNHRNLFPLAILALALNACGNRPCTWVDTAGEDWVKATVSVVEYSEGYSLNLSVPPGYVALGEQYRSAGEIVISEPGTRKRLRIVVGDDQEPTGEMSQYRLIEDCIAGRRVRWLQACDGEKENRRCFQDAYLPGLLKKLDTTRKYLRESTIHIAMEWNVKEDPEVLMRIVRTLRISGRIGDSWQKMPILTVDREHKRFLNLELPPNAGLVCGPGQGSYEIWVNCGDVYKSGNASMSISIGKTGQTDLEKQVRDEIQGFIAGYPVNWQRSCQQNGTICWCIMEADIDCLNHVEFPSSISKLYGIHIRIEGEENIVKLLKQAAERLTVDR